MTSRYDALIRLTLGAGARLSGFCFDGHIMTAPLSLPRLAEGANPMQLRCLDKHRLRTTPWVVPVDFRSESALRRHLVGVESGRIEPGARDRVRLSASDGVACAVFRFFAPTARRFAWAYVVATVPEGPADMPARRATLEWSIDGVAWSPLAAIAVPNTPLQWDGSLDGELRLPEAGEQVWLRVTSGTGLTAFEFTGHLLEPASPAGLRIIHRWHEGNDEREFAAPAGAAEYAVVCGPAPHRHGVEMGAPSVPRQDASFPPICRPEQPL